MAGFAIGMTGIVCLGTLGIGSSIGSEIAYYLRTKAPAGTYVNVALRIAAIALNIALSGYLLQNITSLTFKSCLIIGCFPILVGLFTSSILFTFYDIGRTLKEKGIVISFPCC